MSLIRSASGLSNYRHFIDSEIIVYIEGQEGKHDKYFYENLITLFTAKKVTFIPKGSSTTVFDYLSKISNENIENSFVIFDKDLTGLTISKRYQNKMITTCFYSWENDLLDKNIVYDFFSDFCLDFGLRSKFFSIFDTELNKLDEIIISDSLLQRVGTPLLDKDKASFGVNFVLDETKKSIISNDEISRVLNKVDYSIYVTDPVFMDLRVKFGLFDIRMYIQGHFYEYFCYKLVHCLVSDHDPNFKKLSQNNFMTIILGKFSKSPREFINDEVYEHYLREFSRVFGEIDHAL